MTVASALVLNQKVWAKVNDTRAAGRILAELEYGIVKDKTWQCEDELREAWGTKYPKGTPANEMHDFYKLGHIHDKHKFGVELSRMSDKELEARLMFQAAEAWVVFNTDFGRKKGRIPKWVKDTGVRMGDSADRYAKECGIKVIPWDDVMKRYR